MLRVFKARHFVRWQRGTDLTDKALCKAVQEMQQGLIEADLGFEKSERENIDAVDLKALKNYAQDLLGLRQSELISFLANGSLQEICHE